MAKTEQTGILSDLDPLLTLDEVARVLKVHRRTLSRWRALGRLKVIKTHPSKGGRCLIERRELERFLAEIAAVSE